MSWDIYVLPVLSQFFPCDSRKSLDSLVGHQYHSRILTKMCQFRSYITRTRWILYKLQSGCKVCYLCRPVFLFLSVNKIHRVNRKCRHKQIHHRPELSRVVSNLSRVRWSVWDGPTPLGGRGERPQGVSSPASCTNHLHQYNLRYRGFSLVPNPQGVQFESLR